MMPYGPQGRSGLGAAGTYQLPLLGMELRLFCHHVLGVVGLVTGSELASVVQGIV